MPSNISRRPKVSQADMEKFINGAPDAGGAGAGGAVSPSTLGAKGTGGGEAGAKVPEPQKASARKQPISLTIDPGILAELDDVAAGMGISRAAAFSMAVSKLIAQHKKEG